MTNKEKSEEIAKSYSSEVLQAGVFFGAEKMAEWKDAQYSQDESYNRGIHDACQQFKEYLEKKRDSMTLFPTEYDMCQEIISELFEDGKDD